MCKGIEIKSIGMIAIEDFDKVDVRIGTIVRVELNEKARKPAYSLWIDFGEELGVKTSSSQLTGLYSADELVGKQVACCVNLAPIRVGGFPSEVRVLGMDTDNGVCLLESDRQVRNGLKVY